MAQVRGSRTHARAPQAHAHDGCATGEHIRRFGIVLLLNARVNTHLTNRKEADEPLRGAADVCFASATVVRHIVLSDVADELRVCFAALTGALAVAAIDTTLAELLTTCCPTCCSPPSSRSYGPDDPLQEAAAATRVATRTFRFGDGAFAPWPWRS